MKLQQNLQTCLEDWARISGLKFALLNPEDTLMAKTGEVALPKADKLAAFREGNALSVSNTHFSLHKVIPENKLLYILVISGESEAIPSLGQLAVCQVKSLLQAYGPKEDKTTFLHDLLLGDLPKGEVVTRAKQLRINQETRRIVLYIQPKSASEEALTTIRNIFVSRGRDYVIPMGDTSIVVLRELLPSEHLEEIQEVALMLVDMLGSEALISAQISYSSPAQDLCNLPTAYQEAKMAMEIGKLFLVPGNVFPFHRLGIGRLIYCLPQEVCEAFVDEIFGERKLSDLDEDMHATIRILFENNLNLSETARQLFVHRNTLVYRFEKLQKRYNLDLRQFEDAVTFKIGMMVLEYLNSTKFH